MKVVQQKVEVKTQPFSALIVGQVYSTTMVMGARSSTLYYLRTDKGMACLDTGAFIFAEAFTHGNGAYRGLCFLHCPDAKVTV